MLKEQLLVASTAAYLMDVLDPLPGGQILDFLTAFKSSKVTSSSVHETIRVIIPI